MTPAKLVKNGFCYEVFVAEGNGWKQVLSSMSLKKALRALRCAKNGGHPGNWEKV
jgi:hypothetical protein